MRDDNITICSACEKDIDEIYNIEKVNFKYPWSKENFFSELKISRSGKGFFYILKIDNIISGYLCGRIVEDEINIINISIKKEFQRSGFGKKVLNYLLKSIEEKNIKYVYLEVRESNFGARNFYEKFGFKNFWIRKNFYSDGEDAIVMKLNLKERN